MSDSSSGSGSRPSLSDSSSGSGRRGPRVAAVVLAAGQGMRFRSDLAKVRHPACGRPLLRWVLEALRPLELDRVVVVVGTQAEEVAAEAKASGLPHLETVVQPEQRGTGHALRVALSSPVLDGVDSVLVVPGDTPCLRPEPLRALLDEHAAAGRSLTLLSTRLDDPTGYGRLLRGAGGVLERVVEERDASEAERALDEVNTSIYVFARAAVQEQLERLSTSNAQGEEYLTDVVEPLAAAGTAGVVSCPAEDVTGVNDRVQLAAASSLLRRRLLERLMRAGVTVADPVATYVEADVEIEADAVLLPGTHLEGATRVGRGATIGPNSRLVDSVVEAGACVAYSVLVEASVGPQAVVGPFSYLRPGARLEARAKAGAFVEVKNSTVGEGSKVPHLSYVGDATIGKGANIGAAAVVVNYDGFEKHRTVIGDGARIGSDTMLVAPVRIGDGAFTGAGSVITQDVPDGALAIERGEQRIIEGYAQRKRARYEAERED